MRKFRKCVVSLTLVASMVLSSFSSLAATKSSDDPQIEGITASGTDDGTNVASNAVDGKTSTYWNSAESSMQDYRRFLDFDLGGEYNVSKVKIQLNTGSYYHYEIYASDDGVTYDKIAYKSDNTEATETGDSYSVSVKARYLRVNVSYNSAKESVNIAEFSVYGTLRTKDAIEETEISVTDFEDSEWGIEWNKVESDEEYANQKTISEMSNLVERVIGAEYRDKFVFELRDDKDGNDVFEVQDGSDGTILIRGNNGISMASGFNYYLRYYAKVDYNPLFGSNLDMPSTLPKVGEKLVKYTEYDYRYALNFCTYSYTMAFWGWDEYESFLDWCAMNGVNLVLDIVGQEEVLRQTLLQYGYTTDEVKEYISGPAYYAWFYMQNLYAAGGPLPNAWFENRVELARQIHDRMQTYGITPVIQGFGGQVPTDFEEKNPDSVAASSGSWCGYDRPYMIKTYLSDSDIASGKQDYFQMVGTTFYETQEKIFGKVSNYYAVDPFHEGGTVPDGYSIIDIYRVVQEKMLEYDEDAIWVMQQWQWGISEEKLSGLAKKEQAIVLDLQSDLRSQASPMENQGVPWIWNMLHNFGGRMGMDGVPEVIATSVSDTYKSSNYMCGIGITPEAIENSPIVYELLFDMTWEQDDINYRSWTKDYIERRYGGTDETIEEAWDILLDTAYNYSGSYYQGASESVINSKPTANTISSASSWGHSDINYDKEEFEKAAQLFIDSYDKYKDSEAFMYDFVDVMRQVLANAAQEYQPLMGQAYKDKDLATFKKLSEQFLSLIEMQDKILATSDGFLVGTWIDNARTMLGDDMDDWTRDLFEYNARSLITVWGMQKSSESGGLNDYSNRQWAGLTGDYYYSRWETWINNRITELETGSSVSDPNWYMYGLEWATRKSDEDGYGYTATASGEDVKALAQEALNQFSVTNMDAFLEGMNAAEVLDLALNKTVTEVSTGTTISDNLVTDGGTDTGWSAGKTETTLELDLEGTYDIQTVGFTLQQLAASFPVKYVIQVWNGDSWVEVGRSDADTITTKNEISCEVSGSKIRYTFTSTDGANLVNIYELVATGTAQEEVTYENIAANATYTASSYESSNRVPEKVADGSTSTLWVNNGSGAAWLNANFEDGEYVDKVNLVFERAGLKFQFKVVATTLDGEEVTLLDLTDNQTDLAASYTMNVGEFVTDVKVVFTGAVAGTTPWPAIAELEILQSVVEKEYENIASTATATSSAAKASPEDASALIDGTDTAWVSANGAVPAWVQLDLPEATSLDEILLQFEKGQDRSMQFTVTVTNAAGESEVVYERDEDTYANSWQGEEIAIDLSDSVVAKTAVTVRMDITAARYSGGSAWPLIREIQLLKEKVAELPLTNVASNATATSSAAKASPEDASALIDGTSTAWVSANGAVPAWVQLDFATAKNAQEIVMKFESGQDRSMQFIMTGTNEAGETVTIYERDADTYANSWQGDEIHIDVSNIPECRTLTNIRVDISAARYSGGSAWPLIAEIEVYAYPNDVAESGSITSNDKTVSQSDLNKLLDSSNTDTVALTQSGEKTVTIELAKGTDINFLQLLSSSTEALRFKAEYLEPGTDEYKTWMDYSNNRSTQNPLLLESDSAVYAKTVRLTFYNSEVDLTGIRIYEADMSGDLISYIATLESAMKNYSYGETAGKITNAAKAVLEAKIAEANKAIEEGINSQAVTEWISTLKSAYRTFYETGYVQLKPQFLYGKIEDAKDLTKVLSALDMTEEAATLTEKIAAANAVATSADSTQEDIDNAKIELDIIYQEMLKLANNQGAKLYGVSVSLDDVLGLNYYLALPESVLSDDSVKAVFTSGDKTVSTVSAKELAASKVTVDGKTLYKITCPVTSDGMTEGIVLTLTSGSLVTSTLLETESYTVAQYADVILNGESYSEKTKALVTAMLNYGAAAQEYFAYNDNEAANSNLAEDQKVLGDVSADSLSAFASTKEGAVEGISYYGASLLLYGHTTIRHYFKVTDGSIDDYTFTVDGSELTPVKKGSYYYVDLSYVDAANLGTMYQVKVTKAGSDDTFTVAYSVMTYVKNKLGKVTGTEETLVKALYWYYKAACDYKTN